MLKLYTDKSEIFECNVALEGVDIKDSKIRAILKFDDKNLMIEGKIKSGGKGEIIFPKLKGLTKEGQKGTMELEVIADDAYFQPYEENFEVKVIAKILAASHSTGVFQPNAACNCVLFSFWYCFCSFISRVLTHISNVTHALKKMNFNFGQ